MDDAIDPHRSERLAGLGTLSLLLLAALWLYLGPGQLDAELAAFLPPPVSEEEGSWPLPERLTSGTGGQHGTLLAAIEGGEGRSRARASRQLAERLADHPDIHRAHNGRADGEVVPEGLFSHRYLLSPLLDTTTLDSDTLEAAFARRHRELASASGGPARQWLEADPVGAWVGLLAMWRGAHELPRPHGVWADHENTRALLLIESRLDGSDPEAESATLERLRAEFAATHGDDGLRLQLTGPAVFAADSSRLIQGEITRLSLLASAMLALLLLLAFRSPRFLLLAGLPLGGAILGGAALVMALFGNLHGIALAFGILLVGVALDYPLHLFSHQGGGRAPWATARHLWPTLRLGALTTVLGFAAMALADLRGLAQLGVFALGGLPMALLLTRYVLPGLLPATTAPTTSPPDWLLCSPPRGGPWWGLGLLLVAAMVLFTQRDQLWQHDLAALNPVPEATRAMDRELREALGGSELRRLAVIRGDDPQTVLLRSHALDAALAPLREEGHLTGVDHPARWLPPVAVQEARRARLPSAETLEERVAAAASEAGFRPAVFAPFVADIAASRDLAPLTPSDLEGWVARQLGQQLFREGEHWYGLVRFRGVTDGAALAGRVTEHAPEEVLFIDTVALASASLAAFRQQALQLSALGGTTLLLVLMFALGSARRGLRAAAAPLAAIVVTAAVLIGSGQPLSLFHLVSLLLVAGLGLDYSLFLLRHDGRPGEGGPTRLALGLCLLSTLAVFGAMALSELTVLADIGNTVVIGALSALLLAWLIGGTARYDGAGRARTGASLDSGP